MFTKNTQKYQKYVILSTYRSGTNYLTSLLNSHPSIISHHEIFRDHYFSQLTTLSAFSKVISRWLRDFFPQMYINKFIFKSYPGIVGAVGFEVLYTNERKWQTRDLRQYLNDMPELKIIHLIRKNLLRVYLSLVTANKLLLWVSTRKNNQVLKPIKINPAHLELFFNDITRLRVDYQKYFKQKEVLEINYEDLVTRKDKQMAKILAFLGVSKRKLSSPLVKLNNRLLKDCIRNYSELKRHFYGSKWQHFFDDNTF